MARVQDLSSLAIFCAVLLSSTSFGICLGRETSKQFHQEENLGVRGIASNPAVLGVVTIFSVIFAGAGLLWGCCPTTKKSSDKHSLLTESGSVAGYDSTESADRTSPSSLPTTASVPEELDSHGRDLGDDDSNMDYSGTASNASMVSLGPSRNDSEKNLFIMSSDNDSINPHRSVSASDSFNPRASESHETLPEEPAPKRTLSEQEQAGFSNSARASEVSTLAHIVSQPQMLEFAPATSCVQPAAPVAHTIQPSSLEGTRSATQTVAGLEPLSERSQTRSSLDASVQQMRASVLDCQHERRESRQLEEEQDVSQLISKTCESEVVPYVDKIAPTVEAVPMEVTALEETSPVEEKASVKEAAPVQEAAPVEEAARMEEATPLEQEAQMGEVAPLEEAAQTEVIPVEATPVEEVAPAEEVTPVKETAPVVEELATAVEENVIRAEDTVPVEETMGDNEHQPSDTTPEVHENAMALESTEARSGDVSGEVESAEDQVSSCDAERVGDSNIEVAMDTTDVPMDIVNTEAGQRVEETPVESSVPAMDTDLASQESAPVVTPAPALGVSVSSVEDASLPVNTKTDTTSSESARVETVAPPAETDPTGGENAPADVPSSVDMDVSSIETVPVESPSPSVDVVAPSSEGLAAKSPAVETATTSAVEESPKSPSESAADDEENSASEKTRKWNRKSQRVKDLQNRFSSSSQPAENKTPEGAGKRVGKLSPALMGMGIPMPGMSPKKPSPVASGESSSTSSPSKVKDMAKGLGASPVMGFGLPPGGIAAIKRAKQNLEVEPDQSHDDSVDGSGVFTSPGKSPGMASRIKSMQGIPIMGMGGSPIARSNSVRAPGSPRSLDPEDSEGIKRTASLSHITLERVAGSKCRRKPSRRHLRERASKGSDSWMLDSGEIDMDTTGSALNDSMDC